MYSSVLENLKKQSFVFKFDIEKPQVDELSGKIQNEKPSLFQDSYLDNPPNYLYMKFARENRRNDVDLN